MRRSLPAGRAATSVALATLATLAILAAGAAKAQSGPDLDLRGELALTGGAIRLDADALPEPTTARPLSATLRLDATLDVGSGVALRAVIAPSVAFGRPGMAPDEVVASPGLEAAYARVDLPFVQVEASAGIRRWTIGETRLQPVVRLDGVDTFGTPRGLLGARTVAYLHPWRLGAALLAPLDDDLRPTAWGGAAAARWDVANWTFEGHAFLLDRAGGGLTASGTVGDHVVYGEGWLLGDPWELRGGGGATSYLADVLVTVEGAWAPASGALDGTPRPSVRASAQASPSRDVALDASGGVAWPEDPARPGERIASWDARLALSLDGRSGVLTLTPSLQHGFGATTLGATLTFRTFF